VFVALGAQQVTRMRHIVICGLPGATVISHVISKNGKIFFSKVIEYKMWFYFVYSFAGNISHSK